MDKDCKEGVTGTTRSCGGTRQTAWGTSLLDPCAIRPIARMELDGELSAQRRTIAATAPVCPGVYGWLNPDGIVNYVGKAKSLRHRLTGYFSNPPPDPKMERIRRHSSVLIWEPISHELLALVRELELIERFRPSFNVTGKPERRQPGFICIGTGQAPRIFFSRSYPAKASTVVGPFAGRGEMRDAVTSMNYVFRLRDCPDRTPFRFSNQLQLFDDGLAAGCLRHELGSCPAPCAARCSADEYRKQVHAARKFLESGNTALIGELDGLLENAIANLAFERAGVLESRLRHLKWMERRVRQVQRARKRLNGVWVVPGFDRQQHGLLLRGGLVVGGCRVPVQNSPDGKLNRRIREIASAEMRLPDTSLATSWFLLLESWFRRFPDDATKLVSFDEYLSPASDQRACA